MKTKTLLFIILSSLSFSVFAQDDPVEDITMDVMDQKRGHHRAHREIKRLVAEYMLEQGDITLEELEMRRDERKAVREELKTLRDNGDEEALAARLGELREQRADQREQFKEYLAENDELAQAIRERKEELRERRRERKEERRQQNQEDS